MGRWPYGHSSCPTSPFCVPTQKPLATTCPFCVHTQDRPTILLIYARSSPMAGPSTHDLVHLRKIVINAVYTILFCPHRQLLNGGHPGGTGPDGSCCVAHGPMLLIPAV